MKNLYAALFVLLLTVSVYAQPRIKVLAWNIESGDSEINLIQSQLSAFEGFDLMALTEVNPFWASFLAEAAGVGEGARGESQADFDYILGTTGNDIRMMIIWDAKRFETLGDPIEIHQLNSPTNTHRSPLYVRFRMLRGQQEFMFMVNHLARGDASLRVRQAQGLQNWVQSQEVPVIAAGDFNFDYEIDDGMGNPAMTAFLEGDHWQWIRPQSLYATQSSSAFHSILDFVFTAHFPETWELRSNILRIVEPFEDTALISDHRPVEAVIYLSEPTEFPVF